MERNDLKAIRGGYDNVAQSQDKVGATSRGRCVNACRSDYEITAPFAHWKIMR